MVTVPLTRVHADVASSRRVDVVAGVRALAQVPVLEGVVIMVTPMVVMSVKDLRPFWV
jgi:hypothetical protein